MISYVSILLLHILFILLALVLAISYNWYSQNLIVTPSAIASIIKQSNFRTKFWYSSSYHTVISWHSNHFAYRLIVFILVLPKTVAIIILWKIFHVYVWTFMLIFVSDLKAVLNFQVPRSSWIGLKWELTVCLCQYFVNVSSGSTLHTWYASFELNIYPVYISYVLIYHNYLMHSLYILTGKLYDK